MMHRVAGAGVLLASIAGVVQAETIDQILATAVEEGRVPGVVAMVANADEILYAGAFGKARVGDDVDMTLETIFSIASMTKPVTAVAAMQLVESGELSLDAPMSTYLPEFEAKPVLLAVENGTPRYSTERHDPTLRQLMSHSSGFAYSIWNEMLFAISDPADDDPRSFVNEPLVFEPGAGWHYGTGLEWSAEIVMTVTGTDLATRFRESIFGPLGMNDTGYTLSAEQFERLVTTHGIGPDGTRTEMPLRPNETPAYFGGGYGLYSTAADYVRFMQMFLQEGAGILDPESVAAMGANQIGEAEVVEMPSQIAASSTDFDVHPGIVDRFGLGLLVNMEDIPGRRRAGSLMWAGMSNTHFWIDRTSGLCGVFLTQVLPFYEPDIIALLEAFETAAYAAFGE